MTRSPQQHQSPVDVLAVRDEDVLSRWGSSVALSVLLLLVMLAVVSFARPASVADEQDDSMVLVEIAPPEPSPEPPSIEEQALVTVPAPPEEPEPVPQPPTPPPEPESEEPPPAEEEPRPPPEESQEALPTGEPKALEEDQRPISIGLEESSFQDGESGPTFAQGDTARGGRPARRSVDSDDDREAVSGATADGEGDRPARRPTARRQQGGETRDPKRVSGVPLPEYPPLAERREIEGVCSARLAVSPSGHVSRVTSLDCKPSGFGFEEQFRTWATNVLRFESALDDGRPVETTITYRHGFRLP